MKMAYNNYINKNKMRAKYLQTDRAGINQSGDKDEIYEEYRHLPVVSFCGVTVNPYAQVENIEDANNNASL